ncbi:MULTISPECIES: VOC family protein [unclassified Acinetobacter]|uniref:VOC family protein n=1 Tax=unclassified Acinetobacter TaxID=196816 RepID=UPI0029343ACD|nr:MULTISPECIES: VOC family protein [unclassified Acinetobacter]WOE32285.1 glyoxalase [Acinetobacter sp. SAAs470]WOE37756.1 glyoxalase [Acinetobacter sp. SAAs474]
MYRLKILFVAGFGPITTANQTSKSFYLDTLNLPLQPMFGNESYLSTEQNHQLEGVKHFALWPLSQAAQSCFGIDDWPKEITIPQSWIEFEVDDLAAASDHMVAHGYQLLVNNRIEPWGQSVTRFLSPEGILTSLTVTPWLHETV